MLKRALLLIALLILLGSTMSFATNDWYYVGNAKGLAWYIDNTTVEKDDKTAYLWVKMRNSYGSELWAHVMVSRYGKTFTVTEERGRGWSRKLNPYTEIRPIVPGAPIEKIVDLIW